MKKDEIKVLIDSEEKFNEAKSLLLEFGQKLETDPEFKYAPDEYIYYHPSEDNWCVFGHLIFEEQVTLDQLREILSVELTQKMSD